MPGLDENGLFVVLRTSTDPFSSEEAIQSALRVDARTKDRIAREENKLEDMKASSAAAPTPATRKAIKEQEAVIGDLKRHVGTPRLNNNLLAPYTGQKMAYHPDKCLAELDPLASPSTIALTALDVNGINPHTVDPYYNGGVAVLANLGHANAENVLCKTILDSAWLKVIPGRVLLPGTEMLWDYSCESDNPSDLLIDCLCGCDGKLFKPWTKSKRARRI